MDFTFKSVGRPTVDILSESEKTQKALDEEIPIGIMTPLRYSTAGTQPSIFAMHYDITDQISDNLRNLIMTNHGDRLGRPNLGANIMPLSLEVLGQENFESEAMKRISKATAAHLPFISLKTMTTTRLPPGTNGSDNPQVLIRLEYNVKGLSKKKALEVIITLAG